MSANCIKVTAALAVSSLAGAAHAGALSLDFLGRYGTGVFDGSASEIAAHDAATQRLFVTNGDTGAIDVLDISDPANPTLAFSIDLSQWGSGANSVASSFGVIAVAVEADIKTDPGRVVFFDTNGNYRADWPVGPLPDMLTFSPNGRWLLVANEGEPSDDYLTDPEGSISVIKVRAALNNIGTDIVRTADFGAFNVGNISSDIRIFGPNASVAQDLEPEYIAISPDSKTAWVSCQENNALAIVDIFSATVTAIVPLGFKDHSLAANALDASNQDAGIDITTWPVYGMYQPDAIAAFSVNGETYIASANEGDARDYGGFSEEERIGDLPLDPSAFPNAADLQMNANLGRLNSTVTLGDDDGDGDFDRVFAYGARSMSIWNAQGQLVSDTGDEFEQIIAAQFPAQFNSNNDDNTSFDSRSDDKGPEPEGLTVWSNGGAVYAFVGLERIGGVMIYDVSDPANPAFVSYTNPRDFSFGETTSEAGDLGPEGLLVIEAADSPTGAPLLVVTNEVSGTTSFFEIVGAAPATCDVAGDLNGDCTVDAHDLDLFLSAYGDCAGDCAADLDGDGVVGATDLRTLIGTLGGEATE